MVVCGAGASSICVEVCGASDVEESGLVVDVEVDLICREVVSGEDGVGEGFGFGFEEEE